MSGFKIQQPVINTINNPDEPIYNASKLLDVAIMKPVSLSNGQVMMYDSSAGEWVIRYPPQADVVYSDFVNACVTIYMSGIGGSCSGFLVNATGRIICSGHCVCVAAVGSNGDLVLGTQPVVAPTGSIYATISNIDGTGRTEVRACSVVGVDMSADIAVLQTDIPLTNQEFLSFGKSRDVENGSKAVIIGDPGGNDFQSASMGVVRDARYTPNLGGFGGSEYITIVENVYHSVPTRGGNSGSAILDAGGKIIGIHDWGDSLMSTFGGGPAQYTLEPVIDNIVAVGGDYQSKVYWGIQWRTVRSNDIAALGLPFTFGIRGIRILSVGVGATPVISTANSSPAGTVTGTLLANDIILSINGHELGNLSTQTSPATVARLITPPAAATIVYVRPPSTIELTVTLATVSYATVWGIFERLGIGAIPYYS